MPKIFINEKPINVDEGLTVLQAWLGTNAFCYHERLSIAGNCRMCLVEMENLQTSSILRDASREV